MLALQLSVGRPINIQSRACCSSTFGCDAWWGSWDQPPGISFPPSHLLSIFKTQAYFFCFFFVGLVLYFSFTHAFQGKQRVLLGNKLAWFVPCEKQFVDCKTAFILIVILICLWCYLPKASAAHLHLSVFIKERVSDVPHWHDLKQRAPNIFLKN